VLSYIHNNPLNALIVNNLEEYPWSSYCLYTQELSHLDFLINGENILSLFSPDKERAIDLFIQCHHQNVKRENNIIELPEKDRKYNQGLINEREVKQYIQNYFEKFNLELTNLKEKEHQSHRNNLISYLKLNSNLSIRGIANILGIGATIVHKIQLKKEQRTVPCSRGGI